MAVIDAVEKLHQQRIIHGDLNVYNILVSLTSESSFEVRLIDFGFASCLGGEARTANIDPSESRYTHPELCSPKEEVVSDYYHDAYALAASLAHWPPLFALNSRCGDPQGNPGCPSLKQLRDRVRMIAFREFFLANKGAHVFLVAMGSQVAKALLKRSPTFSGLVDSIPSERFEPFWQVVCGELLYDPQVKELSKQLKSGLPIFKALELVQQLLSGLPAEYDWFLGAAKEVLVYSRRVPTPPLPAFFQPASQSLPCSESGSGSSMQPAEFR